MRTIKSETATIRNAVKILMLSPIYPLLTLSQRLVLVREYCQAMMTAGF